MINKKTKLLLIITFVFSFLLGSVIFGTIIVTENVMIINPGIKITPTSYCYSCINGVMIKGSSCESASDCSIGTCLSKLPNCKKAAYGFD